MKLSALQQRLPLNMILSGMISSGCALYITGLASDGGQDAVERHSEIIVCLQFRVYRNLIKHGTVSFSSAYAASYIPWTGKCVAGEWSTKQVKGVGAD